MVLIEHLGVLASLLVFLGGQLVAAIIWGANMTARLSVLESTVAINKKLANGVHERVEEIDQHGSRNVPLLNERLVNEHVRIDSLLTKIELLVERIAKLERNDQP